LDLTGRVAIVTGGGTGIGAAVARIFAEHGAEVVISSRNEANLKKAADEIIAGTGKTIGFIAADLSKEGPANALVQKVAEQHGRVDILVNNAGGVNIQLGANLPDVEAIADTPTDRWLAMMDLNVNGPFYLTRAVLPHMLRQGKGVIVNHSSNAGPGLGGFAGYAAGKAALESLTRSTAAEYGKFGIRANAIVIGAIRTELPMLTMERAGYDRDLYGATSSLARGGEPSEIAHTALFLASDASSYITGETIEVSGGNGLGNSLQPNHFEGRTF
jgi:citronellol/citronellal dehydrogenase